jgi:probable H4MPT-linked C1 transfer pathway protein
MRSLALDIGGANIKAAFSDRGAWSVPFALWKEPERLTEKLRHVAALAPPFTELRITMTGELCDCFATKREGVNHILAAAEALAAGRTVNVWSVAGCFVGIDVARADPIRVAASNWHALATFVARLFPDGDSLLVDVGSTTTDIIPLSGGRVMAKGANDMERLANRELIYGGAMRTPLMALGTEIQWRGATIGVMAERFATAADVYVLTGDVPEDPDDCDTADGRPLTKPFAAARIVRMIGADLELFTTEDAVELARLFADSQGSRISQSIGRHAINVDVSRVIVSGSGEFLARRATQQWAADRAIKPEMVSLSDRIGAEASSAACAYALLKL